MGDCPESSREIFEQTRKYGNDDRISYCYENIFGHSIKAQKFL